MNDLNGSVIGEGQLINDEFIVGGFKSDGVCISLGNYDCEIYRFFTNSKLLDSLSKEEL